MLLTKSTISVLHLLILALLLCSKSTLAFRLDFDGWNLPVYDPKVYRQHPYHRVGLFSSSSSAAIISGKKGEWSKIKVNLKVTDAPHGFFQVFIYNADYIEKKIVPSLPTNRGPIHPCMDFGQENGAFMLANMTHEAYTISSHALEIRHESNRDLYVDGELFLYTTGLYVITVNACKYNTKREEIIGADNVTRIRTHRQLDTTGWHNARVHGSITVKNPYGYLLGQDFGYMPAYATCLILASVLFLIFFGVCIKVGLGRLLAYQKALLVLAISSTSSYLLLAAYFFAINGQDKQHQGMYTAASIGLMIRSTFSRCIVYLLCAGWTVTKKSLPYEKWVMIGVFAFVHFCLYLIQFLLDSLHDRGTAGFDVADRPQVAITTTGVVGIVLEVAAGIAITWELKQTRLLLKTRLKSPQKRELYTRTMFTLIVYVFFGLLWLFFIGVPGSPVGEEEDAWKMWWLRGAIWEMNYLLCYSAFIIFWMPGKVSNKYLALDDEMRLTGDGEEGPSPGDDDESPERATDEEMERIPAARFRAPRMSEGTENRSFEGSVSRGNPPAFAQRQQQPQADGITPEVDYDDDLEGAGSEPHPAVIAAQREASSRDIAF